MGKLLLVKHAMPEIRADVPSAEWTLSAAGCEAARRLGEDFREQGVTRIFASSEPKALQTARLAAAVCALPVTVRADLRENDRTGLGFLSSAEIKERIRSFFAEPARVVMGRETADAAFLRFSGAVAAALREAAGETTAVVAHGTVISLFVSRHNPIAPFALWERLGLPSYVVLDAQSFAFDGRVRSVAG